MNILFYIFASLIILSSIYITYSKNPINSVLALIFCFINTSGIFILLKAEFLAMLFIIIYVGAIAILFLFIIMMIDMKNTKYNSAYGNNKLSIIISLIIISELIILILMGFKDYKPRILYNMVRYPLSNIDQIGNVLYTKYILNFQISGIILLTAMVGSIILTNKIKKQYNNQDVSEQLKSNPENRLKIINVTSRKGINVE